MTFNEHLLFAFGFAIIYLLIFSRMSFEIKYNAGSSLAKYYHSSSDVCDDPFVQQMDNLAQEIKHLLVQIEDRKMQMAKLADQKIRSDDFSTKSYLTFATHGSLEVDDEVVEIDSDWWFKVQDVKSPAANKLTEMLELDWYVQLIEEKSGPYSLKVPEGWDFHIEKLEWKNDSLYYDGESVCNDYDNSVVLKTHKIIVYPFLESVSDNIYID